MVKTSGLDIQSSPPELPLASASTNLKFESHHMEFRKIHDEAAFFVSWIKRKSTDFREVPLAFQDMIFMASGGVIRLLIMEARLGGNVNLLQVIMFKDLSVTFSTRIYKK
ncbi:hypothetical protein RHMOL_Rhmol02G0103100 [Rhododendron molle]|uniref:Uncharacterized protein n=1 Tax=Rhododendron molle TaxID=49168 RepID=A0ACC0PP11_RHOML|nr:hypothetical protein RHMOL_Rhmol02G0103100 [Rhododendron molle]